MRALIKTALVAAVGAALVAASPALAASKGKRATDARAQGGQVFLYEPADSSQWQIQLEYLKDAPAHNGNNY